MDILINPQFGIDDFIKSWNCDNVKDSHDALIIKDPFKCYALSNFLVVENNSSDDDICQNGTDSTTSVATPCETFLEVLRKELNDLEMVQKDNDLYTFRQSTDLSNIHTPAIEKFKKLFHGPVKFWLQRLTGIELNERVAMTASAYGYTDYLLCHDDELESRRIAYTFYLTPGWTEKDGGRLDLFNSDDDLQPLDIVRSVIPAENMLAFFEVVPRSFHQVSEVFSKDKVRWSINGWFHGVPIERPKVSLNVKIKKISPCSIDFDDLLSWVNAEYLDAEMQVGIRDSFLEKGELELHLFLETGKYENVLSELESDELQWTRKGPRNRRNYWSVEDGDTVDENQFPNLSFCMRLMRSEAMYLLISQFTGLNVHPLFEEAEDTSSGSDDEYNPGSPPTKKQALDNGSGETSTSNGHLSPSRDSNLSQCELEVRRFDYGTYTLLNDLDILKTVGDKETHSIEAHLFFCQPGKVWSSKHGGYICSATDGSFENVSMVTPSFGSLTLLNNSREAQRFVKYVNQKAVDDFGSASSHFFCIRAVYYEMERR